jgi:hypothetical protein
MITEHAAGLLWLIQADQRTNYLNLTCHDDHGLALSTNQPRGAKQALNIAGNSSCTNNLVVSQLMALLHAVLLVLMQHAV